MSRGVIRWISGPVLHARAEGPFGLREAVRVELLREIAQHRPETLILSAAQLGGSLWRTAELERLRDLLTPMSSDIRLVAHIDEPAALLAPAVAPAVPATDPYATPIEEETYQPAPAAPGAPWSTARRRHRLAPP